MTTATRIYDRKKMTAFQRRLYSQAGAAVRHGKQLAEAGGPSVSKPRLLGDKVECLKCGCVVELRHMSSHREACFQ